MAEVTQYTLSLKDIGEMFLRQQGISTGKWLVSVGFGVHAGNIVSPGGSPKPAATTYLDNIAISAIPADGPTPLMEMADFIIDAETLG